jgi:asparagine synthase (glutamine-hydrolysing)
MRRHVATVNEFDVSRFFSRERSMCGICGVAAVDPNERIGDETLRRMADVITYRGPDDFGLYSSPRLGLAMRRLSIIDLEGGKQPVPNEDGSVRLVFNGELYNYRELRSELRSRGHTFATESDTEAVVHSYEEWGADCLARFRGMFAFAIWDAKTEVLFLAVDRFGIKPLYYSSLDGDLVFGSELACLLASGRLEKAIDDAALAEYFTLGYIPPPATIFSSASKLEPGTSLEWRPGSGVEVRRYWDVPSPTGADVPAGDLRASLRELLRDAVRAHLVSDVPLGAFLSGGIDSSSVVALMSEVSDEPVETFSIGFQDRAHDERALARLVAARFNTNHHELVVEPESIDVLPKLVSHFQEPFADSSALPTYYMSKLARESVKVALSGDGGDELFVGYTTFLGVELARRAQALPSVARRALVALPQALPQRGTGRWNDRRAKWQKWAADTALPPEAAYRSKITMSGLSVVGPLLGADLRARLEQQNPFRAVDRSLSVNGRAGPVERALYAGVKVSLAGDMLVKVDRMSMANSLEVRVPLLDHVVAEFVARLPVAARAPRWRLKALLRQTMADVLPREVLRQRKHGFNVPLASWFRGDLSTFAREVLLSREARDRGYVDVPAVEASLRDHERGGRNLGTAIWSLLVFELWCRQILDR